MTVHRCSDNRPTHRPSTNGYDYVDATERWGCNNCAEVEARPKSFFFCCLRSTRVAAMGICSQYFPAKTEDQEGLKPLKEAQEAQSSCQS